MLGVIVFAHGSRDPQWRAPVEAVAAQVRIQDPSVSVVCAYLEFSEPDLSTAASWLVAEGVTTVRVFPLFLGMGKHAREDLPALLAQLSRTYPAVRFERLAAAGEDARLTALLAQIALEPAP